jgi:hypothetical protein
MKIAVSSINEYCLTPDIGNNLKEPKEKQFKIFLKKINSTLMSGKWAHFEKDGEFQINLKSKIKEHIIRIENAPMLDVDGGKKQEEMTVDIMMSDKYSELFGLQNQIVEFIGKLEREGTVETKKY